MTGGLDRLRPRDPERPASGADARPDREGKQALFTPIERAEPARGAVTVDCSACGERSVVGLGTVLRASVPGLHLPVLRRGLPRTRSFLRCPACRQRAWVGLTLRV